MNDNELTKKRILGYLRDVYKQEVYRFSEITQIANNVGELYISTEEFLKQYEKDGFLISQSNVGRPPQYKINIRGLEELSFLESEFSKGVEPNEQHPLDLPVLREDFSDGLRVFISHKFIKKDQELASVLQNLLLTNRINGYLAERTREYELPINEKIQSEILRSDYLVAILTKESVKSASVNQEIGFALGIDVPLIIMVEKGLLTGVLTHGREPEEFTREQFETPCKNVLTYILENGKRKKISDEDKKQLLDNVYRPCYNQMMNEYERRDFITAIPSNKWKDLESFWRLKTESEMKVIFENYTNELEKWSQMWISFANNSQSKHHELGELLKPAFERAGLFEGSMIPLSPNSAINPKDWIRAFEFVIFNNDIHSKEELYKILHDFSIKTKNGHAKWLEEWYQNKPELFFYILETIPKLVEKLNTPVSIEQLNIQREILKTQIEKLKNALEDKLE